MDAKTKAIVKEYVESILVAFVLAMLIRTYVIQAFKIPSGSMIPTLKIGDRLLANKYVYRFHHPKRGEVIIFRCPIDPKKEFIKRLVGLPGDEIEIKDGQVWINGQLSENERLRNIYYYNQGPFGAQNQKTIVPPDAYFVLGDNSGNSRDSRYWGFVPAQLVDGRAILVYWPFSKMRLIR